MVLRWDLKNPNIVAELNMWGSIPNSLTDFSFDETNQTILFESKGESKLASTEVYLDNVLMAPFTVTIDGVADDTFMITEDRTTGQEITRNRRKSRKKRSRIPGKVWH